MIVKIVFFSADNEKYNAFQGCCIDIRGSFLVMKKTLMHWKHFTCMTADSKVLSTRKKIQLYLKVISVSLNSYSDAMQFLIYRNYNCRYLAACTQAVVKLRSTGYIAIELNVPH